MFRMRVYISWCKARSASNEETRLARFKRVLLAVQSVSRYRKYLCAAGLSSTAAVEGLESVEATLKLLPVTDIGEFCKWPGEFENALAFPPGPQRFIHPLGIESRTAVLMRGFRENTDVKIVAQDWARLERFRPESIAAPVGVLRALARGIASGRCRPLPLKYAVIPFTGSWWEGLLREEDRELFWQIFQVPVFEQHLGPDGRVVAQECEAHRGLHLLRERAVLEEMPREELAITSLTNLWRPALRLLTRLAGHIADDECPCGQASPKLMALRAATGNERAPLYAAASA